MMKLLQTATKLTLIKQFFVSSSGSHTAHGIATFNRKEGAGIQDIRKNVTHIQMLPQSMHKLLYKDCVQAQPSIDVQERIKSHLSSHGLWGRPSSETDPVEFCLPELHGNNIENHFISIAKEQSKLYFAFAEAMSSCHKDLPEMPKSGAWKEQQGWAKYVNGEFVGSIGVPDEAMMVFDVEVCLEAGNIPIIATAVSKTAWYCWVSEYLFNTKLQTPTTITPDSMIPMELPGKEKAEKLLIGHNASFDRSYVKDEYALQPSKVRFLDTMSLHMCVSGLTNEQRNYLNAKNSARQNWMEVGTTNSLASVYEFYCGQKLDKSTRDLFVEGSLDDIRRDFQACVSYCARDVAATYQVFAVVWPMFLKHSPHPVTFAGMLEMGTSYLPIDSSWNTYLTRCERKYELLCEEMRLSLMKAADDALQKLVGNRYLQDPWLCRLDWSTQKSATETKKPPKGKTTTQQSAAETNKPAKVRRKTKRSLAENEPASTCHEESRVFDASQVGGEGVDAHAFIKRRVAHLSEKRRNQLHMCGYPKWYRDLCMRKGDPSWSPGPCLVSSQTRVTPSLLRMTWDGYPVHFEVGKGWGYLVPDPNIKELMLNGSCEFPYADFLEAVRSGSALRKSRMSFDELEQEILDDELTSDHSRSGQGHDIGVPGIRFYKIPHKDGDSLNVGNPLSKEYLSRIDDGTLASAGGYSAKQPIELNKMLAFWRNGRKRIMSQMTVWHSSNVSKEGEIIRTGAILPRVVTAGTVTRRAVEPTWLTASNPLPDRLGSELKSMVRAPPGYTLVGADVDSQELWIASTLGDANFSGVHGSTALGWMNLQGKKSDGTDLHSKTADTVGITRDQAKIFNYGRIYGAGQTFAVRLLMQFNHRLSEHEAKEKAAKLYAATKGVKRYRLTSLGVKYAKQIQAQLFDDEYVDPAVMKTILQTSGVSWHNRSLLASENLVWSGGSESEMFNKLESIASSTEPRTPVLGCLISNALSPRYVDKHYMTSRVNWVVQSSAVDYLHLMLVCMNWLIAKYGIEARFCVSIHDEVRYLVSEKDKYRAALALQITNLLTRAMFTFKLGMNDLPQSVAFFSKVDIDKVLRKEVDLDCRTPSNPDGLEVGYGVPPGEALDIYQLLAKTDRGRLSAS